MTARFTSNLLMLILGAFLATTRFVFAPDAVRWIAFGAGVAAVVVVGAAFLSYGRGAIQRTVDFLTAITAGWVVVSGLTFAPGVIGWLALGAGGAIAALAVIGLIAHEAVMQQALWPG